MPLRSKSSTYQRARFAGSLAEPLAHVDVPAQNRRRSQRAKCPAPTPSVTRHISRKQEDRIMHDTGELRSSSNDWEDVV